MIDHKAFLVLPLMMILVGTVNVGYSNGDGFMPTRRAVVDPVYDDERKREYPLFADSLDCLPGSTKDEVLDRYRERTILKPDSQNVRCVGRWPWGPSYEVTAQRDTLYLASGSGVRIVDVTTPANPRHIGQICANGLVKKVAIRDSLLYVAGGGLEIFNVSNPTTPARRSLLNIPVNDVSLKDSFAYCVSNDSFRIVNIKNPQNPFRVGACVDTSWRVCVSGSHAYAGGRWRLAIIDVSNPRAPRRVNALGFDVLAVYVRGDHLYMSTRGSPNDFRIFSVRDPLNPWEEGRNTNVAGYDIHMIWPFAYVPGFSVIDVSDSSNPTVVGSCTMPWTALGVWVSSPFGYAYSAGHYEGLGIINLSDPTQPRIDTMCYKASDARDVFVLNDRAYLADDQAGLKILDISNIATPFEIGSYDTIGQEPILSAIWARDSIVYLGDDISRFPNRFGVVNAKTPSDIRRLGSCGMSNNIESQDMFLKSNDSIVYSANDSYFYGFKVSNLSLPSVVCSLLLGIDQAYGVFVKDSFAYVAGGRSLKIINIANLANPRVVGSCSTSYRANAVYVKDTIAYVVSSNAGGLYIFNVANPSAPFLIAYFLTRDSSARDVWVDDTLAYVATWRSFQIVNVKTPSNPFEVGYYLPPTSITRIFYDGRYIYGAAFEGGMIVFERFMTGIEEESHHKVGTSRRIVYPNPTRRRIFFSGIIAGEPARVRVFDITGRELKELRRVVGTDETRAGLDVMALKPGVYLVLIEEKGSKVVSKIIKL